MIVENHPIIKFQRFHQNYLHYWQLLIMSQITGWESGRRTHCARCMTWCHTTLYRITVHIKVHPHLLSFCWSTSFNSVEQQKSCKRRRWLNFCRMTMLTPVDWHIEQSLSEEDTTFVKLYEIELEYRQMKWHDSLHGHDN